MNPGSTGLVGVFFLQVWSPVGDYTTPHEPGVGKNLCFIGYISKVHQRFA